MPVVLEAAEPPVPDVLDELGGMVELELGVLLLEEPLVPEPDMLPDTLPEVPLVDVSAGVEELDELLLGEVVVLGVVLLVSDVDDELLLGVLVVVPGAVVLEDDVLLGVEPELPVLLQPVAATEASAMTATRGIRRFMTSSPIWFTCVEDKGVGWFRCVGARVRQCASSTRDNDLPRTSRATASTGETGAARTSSTGFSCDFAEKVARKACRHHLT